MVVVALACGELNCRVPWPQQRSDCIYAPSLYKTAISYCSDTGDLLRWVLAAGSSACMHYSLDGTWGTKLLQVSGGDLGNCSRDRDPPPQQTPCQELQQREERNIRLTTYKVLALWVIQ